MQAQLPGRGEGGPYDGGRHPNHAGAQQPGELSRVEHGVGRQVERAAHVANHALPERLGRVE
jgi:hypothetical protein